MKQEKHYIVDLLFVLALFGVFAVSALALVNIGADVYRHTVTDMSTNYETRTSVSYLTEKIRQNDTNGTVSVTTLNTVPALMLCSEVDDAQYVTYLYLYEGKLKELFMREGAVLGGNPLEAGTDILSLQALTFTLVREDLLRIDLTTEALEDYSFYVSVHTK